jgi:hypothetical protein
MHATLLDVSLMPLSKMLNSFFKGVASFQLFSVKIGFEKF